MRNVDTGRAKIRKKPTPSAGSLAAVADFWEQHDSTEYFSEGDLASLRTWTKGEKVRHVFVALDGWQYELIPLGKRPRRKVPA